MAASDVSALIDLASTPDPTPAAEPSAAEPEVDPTELESAESSTDEISESVDTPETLPEDGEKPVDARTNPAKIRSALKAFRDANPEYKDAAKQLNDAYGRYDAYKSVFPKVADAQAAKAILDAVGGNDGITSLQETIRSVNETDSLLYAGDGKVLDSLYEDMKAEGAEAAFGKLAGPFLDKLLKVDGKAYTETLRPHFFQGLINTQFPEVLGALTEALSGETPDIATAQKILGNMSAWFNKLRDSVENGAKANLDPERQKFEQERTEFQTSKQKAFQKEVETGWNSENNRSLGSALKPYLKMAFARNWTDATKVSVAREITSTLLGELTNDKTYQSQMDAFWSAKQPDKSRILDFHKQTVDRMAGRIVKQVLEARYPGFAAVKGGGIAKKAAPGAVKPAADPNKPYQLTSKPKDSDIDWEKDPTRMLFITGKAYLKGSNRFVTWTAPKKTR